LLKLIPSSIGGTSGAGSVKFQSNTVQEIEANFADNTLTFSTVIGKHYWIIDTSAIDHICTDITQLVKPRVIPA